MQVQIRKWSRMLRPAVVASSSYVLISIVLITNDCSFEYLRLWFPVSEKVKVKCTLVQTLKLCTGRTAHRGSRGIAPPLLDHGTRRG